MIGIRLLPICAVMAFITSCKKSDGSNTPANWEDTIVQITPPVVYPGYTLLWNDEFNEPAIDFSKWMLETGTGVNGDFGTGQLDRATNRSENVKIIQGIRGAGGGSLALTTRKEFFVDRHYTSARITTQGKGAWGPGTRIEARIWPRDVRYKGQGFAFWMMPAEKPAGHNYIMWPQGGEIDIMEYVGSIPSHNLGSVHYAWVWNNNEYVSWNHGHKGAYYSFADKQVPVLKPGWGGYPANENDMNAGSSGFHLYRIDWYSDRMEFSVDENVYHIHYFNDGAAFNNNPDGEDADAVVVVNGKRLFKSEYSSNHFAEWSPFEHKFFILFTAGVGGNDNQTYGGAISENAIFPSTTYIDWVRVYQRQ